MDFFLKKMKLSVNLKIIRYFLEKCLYFIIIMCCKSCFINIVNIFIKTIDLIYIVAYSIFVLEK